MNVYNDGHRDRRLDTLLGQRVRIEFKDGDVKEGVLGVSMVGRYGYTLRATRCDYFFCKSSARKVEVLDGRTEKRRTIS